MIPAFAQLAKERVRPDLIICMTDLEIGNPGPEPTYARVIWLGVGPRVTKDFAPRWGKTIIVKPKKGISL